MSLSDTLTITFCIMVFSIQIIFLISKIHNKESTMSISDIEEEYRKVVRTRNEREKRERKRNYEVR